MCDEHEITETLVLLAGARLRNSPGRDEVPMVKQTWVKMMGDIPAGLLTKAAEEHILTGEFWPTPAEIRRLAWKVKLSADNRPGRFEDTTHTTSTHPWAMHVNDGTWQPVTVDIATVRPKQYSPLELLMMRDCGTWTDEEIAWFERETGQEAPEIAGAQCTG